ncbi:MAG: T9SS type A sorting domain-containing protein [Bacteroidales bacterium]|nr:T9SS type A sorting domain-containing protein [Bacteroidales bacterium]
MINIYPNPANDYINVEFGENKTYNVVIFNNLGQKVREVLLTSYNNKINVNDLQSGIYTIKIQVDNVIINKKFSIQ